MDISRRAMLSTALFTAGNAWAGSATHLSIDGAPPGLANATPPAPAPAPPPRVGADTPPVWRRHANAMPPLDGKPAITIIIDDMGWMHPNTAQIAALPGPLTLSWFPFAPRLPEQVAAAMARGHETMLHMPMQAGGNSLAQTGPDPLRVDLPPEINLARLRAAMAAVPMTVGLNNHMGTVATRDPALMDLVAAETRDRGLLFIDSLTVAHSVALGRAITAGVPAAARDVFIDWRNDPATIGVQLADIEAQAVRHGHCIAIGHPRPHTIAALEAWLPTLPGRGFALWPVSATVAWRNRLSFTPMHVS